MKIVSASTEEQEAKIRELIRYVYSAVFPLYFHDKEITEYIGWDVLAFPEHKDNKLFTLEVAFQAISSLQVIIAVLEKIPSSDDPEDFQELFEKNIKILEEAGLYFPFSFEHFLGRKNKPIDSFCSMYANPANELLI